MPSSAIESALGGEFYEKYLEAIRSSRMDRFKITEAMKKDIIKQIIERMPPETGAIQYMHGGTVFHVLLVETPAELNIRQLEFGNSFNVNWMGRRISAVVQEQELEKIAPNQAYIFVGYLKEKQQANRTFLNMTVHSVITMDEVERIKAELSK